MQIRILGAHGRETKSTKCISILLDGVLAIDAGSITSSLTSEELNKIKALLITHAHFDHVKDIPLLSLHFYRMKKRLNIYCNDSVRASIKANLLNGVIYPQLYEIPKQKPTVVFHRIKKAEELIIGNYKVLPLPINHICDTIGYQITDKEEKGLFYTSDTGPGLASLWNKITSNLLIIDTSFPNKYDKYARMTGHLTPNLLLAELSKLKDARNTIPEILVIHNDPLYKKTLKKELQDVEASLNIPIRVAFEGMKIDL